MTPEAIAWLIPGCAILLALLIMFLTGTSLELRILLIVMLMIAFSIVAMSLSNLGHVTRGCKPEIQGSP